jgi:hypothetical protein
MIIFFDCALLAIGIFAYVFFMHDDEIAGGDKPRVVFLKERKDVVYENLRDLNFEFKAGKLPEKDYASLRASMEDEAVAILAEIERLESSAPTEVRA